MFAYDFSCYSRWYSLCKNSWGRWRGVRDPSPQVSIKDPPQHQHKVPPQVRNDPPIGNVVKNDPPGIYGSKVDKHPNGFIGEAYKVFSIMGVSSIKKVDLASYQLKDVAQILYGQLKDSSLLRVGPMEWEIINYEFLDRFFPRIWGKQTWENSSTTSKLIWVLKNTLWNSPFLFSILQAW